MINSISFAGNIQNINPAKGKQSYNISEVPDTFTKSSALSLSSAKSKAAERIIQKIIDSEVEYGFVISPDGVILQENEGTKNSCSVDSRKVESGSVLMHGHPNPTPLSTGDIAVLFATNAISEEAITRDGKFSRLTKKNPGIINPDYRNVYFEFEKRLSLMALDALGIDYKTNEQDIILMFKDFCEGSGISLNGLNDDEIVEKMKKFDIDLSGDLKETEKQLKDMIGFRLMFTPNKYDKEHNTIVENMDSIKSYLDSDDGLMLRNQLLQEVADEYGLIYETNLFD